VNISQINILVTCDLSFRFIVLCHGAIANKIFSTPKIFLAFSILLCIELCFHSFFALQNMTGPTHFAICGIFFDRNQPNLTISYQANIGLILLAYVFSIYFGMRVVRKFREHSANVSENFMVRAYSSKNYQKCGSEDSLRFNHRYFETPLV